MHIDAGGAERAESGFDDEDDYEDEDYYVDEDHDDEVGDEVCDDDSDAKGGKQAKIVVQDQGGRRIM